MSDPGSPMTRRAFGHTLGLAAIAGAAPGLEGGGSARAGAEPGGASAAWRAMAAVRPERRGHWLRASAARTCQRAT